MLSEKYLRLFPTYGTFVSEQDGESCVRIHGVMLLYFDYIIRTAFVLFRDLD
jgi:hypothetical protein